MKKVFVITAIVLLVGMVSAQNMYYVSPAAYKNKEGNSNNNWPFYQRYQKFTYMQLHDDLPKRPMRVTAFAFRRDQNAGSRYTIPAWTATMDVKLSTAKTTSTTASSTYANNHGVDLMTVLTNTVVKFPASSGRPMPKKFVNKIAFPSKPFLFKNTFAGKSICWELRIHSQTIPSGKAPLHDVASARVPCSRSYVGTGGTATGQTRASYNHSNVALVGGGLALYGSQYYTGINETPFMWVGISDKRWGPLPLPFDLTPLGGKGNSIYTDMLALKVGQGKTDTKGYYYWGGNAKDYFVVPADPNLVGVPYWMQMGSSDVKNTAFPFVFTRACKMVINGIPNPIPICRIYTSNDDKATSGSMGSQYGLITEFEYQ